MENSPTVWVSAPTAAPRAVVVGAGPCGALLAAALARAGWRVDVFDRDAADDEGEADHECVRARVCARMCV